jgi:protein-tyrosine kinase
VSLVEKALQKMQAAREATLPREAMAATPDRVIGVIVEEPTAQLRAVRDEPAESHSPARIVRVDRDALRRAGLLPPEAQEHELGDQYRAIKRPLIELAFGPEAEPDGRARLIVLASALPEDGKTFTCVNLSLSLSLEKDYSVLLVDADVAKPHISRLFGIDQEPGLLDVLSDPQRSIESVILPTDVPRLSLLPAGRRSATDAELLGSDRMGEVVRQMVERDQRRIVLFDSSPILLTSEARALTTHVGHVVVVVAAGQTPQQALRDAVEMIGTGHRVSLVLNQAELSGATGYYYGHKYGYGP